MTSISVLRQIVSDIHAVSPEGLRKVLSSELAAKSLIPSTLEANEKAFAKFSKKHMSDFFCSANQRSSGGKLNLSYHQSYSTYYFAKMYEKEQIKFTSRTLKKIGIELKNETYEIIKPEITFNILQGLLTSKKAGFKLPKTVVLEDMTERMTGYWQAINAKKIFINPKGDDLCVSTIHETAHKNDIASRVVNRILFAGILAAIPNKLIPLLNKNLIQKEICNYAAKNRREFIACTVEKLLSEQKTWADLDPKIKKLYDIFLGPKIKLND